MNSKKSSEKRINPVTGKEIDPMFDGHLEKRIKDMTPEEKLKYLWEMMQFKYQIGKSIRFVDDEK
jgi:hypothetical protein